MKNKTSKEVSRLPKASTSQNGLNEGWTRATFIVKKDLLKKIKNIAYWDRLTLKTVINTALNEFLNKKASLSPKKKLNI